MMTEKEIHDICKKYNIKDYTVNPDGSIDVDSDVNLSGKGLKSIPLKFNKVNGYFYCFENKLTSLEGCPNYVGGSFYCYYNKLTSLKGGPKEVGGSFSCYNNNITSLVGFPNYVGGNFFLF